MSVEQCDICKQRMVKTTSPDEYRRTVVSIEVRQWFSEDKKLSNVCEYCTDKIIKTIAHLQKGH